MVCVICCSFVRFVSFVDRWLMTTACCVLFCLCVLFVGMLLLVIYMLVVGCWLSLVILFIVWRLFRVVGCVLCVASGV